MVQILSLPKILLQLPICMHNENEKMICLARMGEITLLLHFFHLGFADALDGQKLLLGRMGKGCNCVDAAFLKLLQVCCRDSELLQRAESHHATAWPVASLSPSTSRNSTD